MKKIKSYSNIWTVGGVLYAIGDVNLPFSLTYMQAGWLALGVISTVIFGGLPPLSWISSGILKHAAIPIAFMFFMNGKTFDGKHPAQFVKTMCLYFFRPKSTYCGKAVKPARAFAVDYAVTTVRRG